MQKNSVINGKPSVTSFKRRANQLVMQTTIAIPRSIAISPIIHPTTIAGISKSVKNYRCLVVESQSFDLRQNQAYTINTEVVVATNHKRASEVTTLIWKSKVSVSNGKLGGTARTLPARA